MCIVIMARTLLLFVWICILNMCLSQNLPLHPNWGWSRQYDTYNSWQVAAAAYKFPVNPQQLPHAAFPLDTENQDNFRPGPDCTRLNPRSSEVPRDSRMNERSIAPSSSVRSQEVRLFQTRVDEVTERRSANGSLKFLSNLLNPGRRRDPVDNHQITFPGPTAMPTNKNIYVPQIPDSCKDATFCEEIPNYPQEEIDRLLKHRGKGLSLQVDQLDLPDTPDITQRVGPTEENLNLCDLKEKVVYPQSVKSIDGKWYTLVNNKDNPVQGFRVELCMNADSNCSNIIAAFQDNYTARCKQKHVLRTVTAIKPENGQPYETQVKIPSCCSCVARYSILK